MSQDPEVEIEKKKEEVSEALEGIEGIEEEIGIVTEMKVEDNSLSLRKILLLHR